MEALGALVTFILLVLGLIFFGSVAIVALILLILFFLVMAIIL